MDPNQIGDNKWAILELNEGLDLMTAKSRVSPGSLLDCLNYENVDLVGNKRIDGYERYDGRVSPSIDTWFELKSTTYAGTIASDFPIGTYLAVSGQTKPFGLVVATDASNSVLRYIRINQDLEPESGDTVVELGEVSPTFVISQDPYDGQTKVDNGGTLPNNATAQDVVDLINGYSFIARTQISDLHSTPIGLHWFRDKLYAVVDELTIYFDSGSTEILPNTYIANDGNGGRGRVLHVEVTSGDWGTGDASGYIQLEDLSSSPNAWDTVSGVDPTLDIYPNDTFGTPDSTDVATHIEKPADADEPKYAAFWKSLTEAQAIDLTGSIDDAGWNRIDSGWEVDYVNGTADSGYFARIQRGQENNFNFSSDETDPVQWTYFYNGTKIQGDPTPGNGGTFGSSSLRVSNGDPGWISSATSDFAIDDAGILTDDSASIFGVGVFGFKAMLNGIALPGTELGAPFAPWNPTPSMTTVGGNCRAPFVVFGMGALAEELPDNSIVTGLEVEIVYSYDLGLQLNSDNRDLLDWALANYGDYTEGRLVMAATFGNMDISTNSFNPRGSKQFAAMFVDDDMMNYSTYDSTTTEVQIAISVTDQTLTIGGAGNTFGGGAISKEDLLSDPTLGFAIHADALTKPLPYELVLGDNFTNLLRLRIDRVRISAYYTEPSVRYYITDDSGTDTNVLSADLVYYTVEDGELTAGTASGKMQFVNIQPVAGNKRTILKGDTIHVANPPDDSNQVAVVDDNSGADTGEVGMVVNGLPSLNRILEADSRYQFITANFYAREDWDGIYGVSGADKAFSLSTFDADEDGDTEDYLIKITSNTNDPEDDIPRHVAYYHQHLALGFRAGVVRLSSPGDPESFDGVTGAAEIGVGDRVTGLLTMRGTTLGVFCENSIWAITGTNSVNFETSVLSPSTGALEYTVVDAGGLPLYCSSQGISTLSQTERYGDFMGQRMSAKITNWLTKRMVKNKNLFSVANGTGVVCAIPVRSKNQYRVFFRDGYVVTLTLNGADMAPTFTFQKYYLNQTDVSQTNRFLVPIAWSSQNDDNGVERIHVSHYSPLSVAESNYVYELDRGWGFDGKFIPAYFTINWYYGESPIQELTLRKVQIDGLTRNYSNLRMYTGKNYKDVFTTKSSVINLPKAAGDSISADFVPASSIANAKEQGEQVFLKINNELPSGRDIDDPEPSHICQVLIISYQLGKIDG